MLSSTLEEIHSYIELTTHLVRNGMEPQRKHTTANRERGTKSQQAREEGEPEAADTSHSGVKYIACLPV